MTISWTAQGAAAQRAVLSDLGLLADPYARGMLSRPMAAISWVFGRVPRRLLGRSVTLAGAAASGAWFDAAISAAMDDGIQQIVTIGAGLDSRAWRLRRAGVQFFELDRADTQQAKIRMAPGRGPIYVAADLRTDDPAAALVGGGLDPTRAACIVVESVTMYLREADVRSLLVRLAKAVASGSRLAVNFLPASPPTTTKTRRQLRLQRLARVGSGESMMFGADPDEAISLVEEAGWTVLERTSFRAAARTTVPADLSRTVDAIDHRKTLLLAMKRPAK